MTRTFFLFVLATLLGCDAKPQQATTAKPIDDGTTAVRDETPPVQAAKPAVSEPAAATAINAILMAHTSSQPSAVERLRKAVIRRSGEGNIIGVGPTKVTMTIHIWGELYRATFAVEAFGNFPKTFSINGPRNWRADEVTQGQAAPLDPTQEEMVLPDVRADRVTLLFPLANPKLVATMARPAQAGGEIIVRVWIDEQPPILVHADPKTNLVKRLSYETKEGGQVAVRTLTFSELTAVAGVLVPKQLAFGLGSTTMTSWTKIDYEVPGVFELSVFDKP